MASFHFDLDDGYDKKCGEMFLTLKGNIVFHCTLCGKKYGTFEQYADHVLIHYIRSSNIKQEITDEVQPAQLNDDNRVLEPKWRKNKPPPLSELMTKLFQTDEAVSSHKETAIKQETVGDDHATTESVAIESEPKNSSTSLESFKIKVEFSETEFSDNELTDQDASVSQPLLDNINYLYECSQCGAVHNTPESLQQHLQTLHSTPSKKTVETPSKNLAHDARSLFICEICGKGLPNSLKLNEHINFYTNENNKKCAYCKASCESSAALHRHMNVHCRERHYECDICKACFKWERGLNEHKRVHGKQERKFACKMCDQKFQLKAGLKWHMRTKHLKTADNTNGCFHYMEVDLGSHVDVMTSAALF